VAALLAGAARGDPRHRGRARGAERLPREAGASLDGALIAEPCSVHLGPRRRKRGSLGCRLPIVMRVLARAVSRLSGRGFAAPRLAPETLSRSLQPSSVRAATPAG